MSLFNIMSIIAKEMDKQRFENMKQQEQLERDESISEYEEVYTEEDVFENEDLDFVKETIEEILTIYNDWAEDYLELERMRGDLDIEFDFEDYFQNLDESILLSQSAYEEIELVPETFEVPVIAQQYLAKVKENFLLALQCHVKRNESFKYGILETIEKGIATEYPIELTNQFLDKAEFYIKSGKRYIDKAIQSVST